MSGAFQLSELLHFLHQSPTPFHAVKHLLSRFKQAGFSALDERDSWQLTVGQTYVYTRSDASIVAFRLGQDLAERGLRIVGAHTDSPCLKLKPSPELTRHGCKQLGIEVYGGALLNPWFDRDLSLAGRVSGLNEQGALVSALVNFERAIACIPNLAIHLDRQANQNKSVNAQSDMNAILCRADNNVSFQESLLEQVNKENPELNMRRILDFNLSFYDVQPPATIGLANDFIASARLDNLLSCYLGAESLLAADTDQTAVLICNDHEEVGSCSEVGAQGTLLNDLVARLCMDEDRRQRCLRQSVLFSVDNAHAIHPNFADKHDAEHAPKINAGPVLKYNADQSYATSSDTAAFVRWLAEQEPGIDLQHFAVRADMRCGSTIGPITAANTGLKTVDIGNAQWAMHSCRELAGVNDCSALFQLLQRFYSTTTAIHFS